MFAAHTPAVLGRRMGAVLAATSAGLHAAMLGHAGTAVGAVLMAAMAAACLYCAYELWRRGTLRVWLTVGLMNLAMIALHLPAPLHHHGPGSAAGSPSLLGLATLIAGAEVALAAAVLVYRTRGRAAELSSAPV